MLNCDCCETGLNWQPKYSGACSCTVCQHTRSSGSCCLPCACSCPTAVWPLKVWPTASRSSALQKEGLSFRCITQGLLCLLPFGVLLAACTDCPLCGMQEQLMGDCSGPSSHPYWKHVIVACSTALLSLPAGMPLCCLCRRDCACHLQHHNRHS